MKISVNLVIAVFACGLLACASSAQARDKKKGLGTPNPDYPKRGSGQMAHSQFFKTYPDHPLILAPKNFFKDDHLGTFQPGQKFGIEFRVSAKGELFGLSHKSAPDPQSVMLCEIKDASGKSQTVRIRPDGGCG